MKLGYRPAGHTVRSVPEVDLAWALLDAAKPHLNALERNYGYMTVGAGDSFAAIVYLINIIAAKDISLHIGLVRLCFQWLDMYPAHEEHARLHRLVDIISNSDLTPAPTPSSTPAAAPQRLSILAVAERFRPIARRSSGGANAQRGHGMPTNPARPRP